MPTEHWRWDYLGGAASSEHSLACFSIVLECRARFFLGILLGIPGKGMTIAPLLVCSVLSVFTVV